MSDTSITDKADSAVGVSGDFVRKLERELNKAKKQIKFFRNGIKLRDEELRKLRNNEYICIKCGIRKNSKQTKGDF